MTRQVPYDNWDNKVLIETNLMALKKWLYNKSKQITGRGDLSDCFCVCMFGFVLQLHWSLSLSDHLIVALEDASLIQMNTDMSGLDITVQGRRKEVLSPVKVRHLTQHTAI